MKIRRLFILLLLFTSCSIFAQQTALKGTIINATTNEPVGGVSVQLKNSNVSVTSSFDGTFTFEGLNPGSDVIVVASPDIRTVEVPVTIVEDQESDIGAISVTLSAQNLLNEGAFVLLEEETVSDDSDVGTANISSILITSNDPYISNTNYNFAAVRFKLRGYDDRYSGMYINGLNFNDAERGGFSYGMIGGLNDATRNQDVVNGMSPSSFTFGQIGGSGNILTNAVNQSQGGRVGVAYTNRNYNWRGTATYSTGLLPNGWAVTGSLAYRYAEEGWIEGTFYNSLGYLLSVSKQINPRHTISFTTFGSPTQRAQQSPIFQEVADLTGSNYHNVYWGWQDGKKRNSRIVTTFEPTATLSHEFKINRDTRLTTGLGFKYTNYGGTRLDWFNARDPRPDYYRNLPSFQDTPLAQDFYSQLWSSGQPDVVQVDWNHLYMTNKLQQIEYPNDPNAIYKVEEQHNDQRYITLNSTLNTRLSDRVTLTAGIDASTTKGMHYKTINDLLGAQYSKDVDNFSPVGSDLAQNDLNNPNRLVKVGERFGYDYDIFVNKANVWLANVHQYKKWDLNYGLNIGYTEFWREGNMRNGRAPENSYGKGETHSFFDPRVKLGITYKLSGRHMFTGNISYQTLPPLTDNAYISSRIKDDAIPHLQSEKVFSADLRYDISMPRVRGSVSVFQTNFYDQAKMYRYYGDLDGQFVNHVLEGLNTVYRGVEFGAKVKLIDNLTLNMAGTIAEYFYNNNPMGTMSYESGTIPDEPDLVYMKNFYVGGTPQTAGTVGLQYFYKYWFFNVDLNGFDRIYVDINPSRRVASAFNDIPFNSKDEFYDFVNMLMQQERFKGGATLDFSIGKSFRLDSKHYLNVNMQFKNVLNNTNLKTGGFEQGRLDASNGSLNVDNYNMDKFPNKYFFAQGFNCFLMAALRF
ncbi:MAG: TonB-dependent receptor [Candidatus Azobacteroides sp.]|nr:TonB-dependent receptor [Candidatus Azobacteroides sp.]